MIIGFTGKKGSGKDTAAAHLVANHGFIRVSFADKLKESAAACFGVPNDIWDRTKNDDNYQVSLTFMGQVPPTKLKSISVRQFLQNYGTEAHRDIFGYDFWVNAAIDPLREDLGKRYVFTDARFDNEAIAIHRLGGSIISIERELGELDSHTSEAGITESLIDGRIRNIGSIDKLNALLDVLVERLTNGD